VPQALPNGLDEATRLSEIQLLEERHLASSGARRGAHGGHRQGLAALRASAAEFGATPVACSRPASRNSAASRSRARP